MSYRDLIKNKQANLEAIAKKIKGPQQEFDEDDRFWYPTVDKAGEGSALIRFLPAHPSDDAPFVYYKRRSFQGPTGKYYIENCRTSLGKDERDPVNEYSRTLLGGKDWKQVSEDIKAKWRLMKGKDTYVCNVYVEKETNKPENEGKVFLFRFGKFFREMIDDKMNPKFEGEERINPFSMDDGCSLRMIITKDGQWRSYKKSTWGPQGPLIKLKNGEPDHDAMEKIYNQVHPLAPFVAPDQFKSYDVLQAKLTQVLGLNSRNLTSEEHAVDTMETEVESVLTADSDDEEVAAIFANLEDA